MRPLFVINDQADVEDSMKDIRMSLDLLHKQGFSGIYIHPRPGMMLEYLSKDWFRLVRGIIKHCREKGLAVGLYDENSYPSGFAGGHVPSQAPETVSRYIIPVFGIGRTALPASFLSLFDFTEGRAGINMRREGISSVQPWVAFIERTIEPSPWHAHFPYVSLLDPQTFPAFLKSTHLRYKEELSIEEWNYIDSMFTDEPHLPGEAHGGWGGGLHASPWIRQAFCKQYGYSLEENLPSLYWNIEGASKVRFDYYELLHKLWVKHWAKPYHDWGKTEKVCITGHYLEHDWPMPYATPGHMHLLKYMDWPGTDVLENFLLEGHDDGDPQNLGACPVGREPQVLFWLRQAQSVANQFGKEKIMCESWGAGGNDSTPKDWLRIGRFLAVNGVNHFVPHYAPVTIRGSRKTDHPQFFSKANPSFSYLKKMNEELQCLSDFVSQGKMENRILLLDPITTGYTLAQKSDCLGLERFEDCWLQREFIGATQKSFEQLRTTTNLLAQTLSDHQMDFDIGDEYIIEEDAVVEERCINIVQQSYQCIVIPSCLENLRRATYVKLIEFLRQGGKVITVHGVGGLLDGEPFNWSKQFESYDGYILCDSHDSLVNTLNQKIPSRIGSKEALPSNLLHQRRVSQNGEIQYLLVNPNNFDCSLHLQFSEGEILNGYYTDTKEYLIIEGGCLCLPATKACLLSIGHSAEKFKANEDTIFSSKKFIDLCNQEPLGIKRQSDNVWVLDSCRAYINETAYEEAFVYLQNERYWQSAGLNNNGLFMQVQFQHQLYQRVEDLAPEATARFIYQFEIGDCDSLNNWRLGVECSEVWKIRVNGKCIGEKLPETWRDPSIDLFCLDHVLQIGENTVSLSTEKFDLRQELDQIYLLGDFSLESTAESFVARKSKPLQIGSWSQQGLPFYDQAILYTYQAVESGIVNLASLPWKGSVLRVQIGDQVWLSYDPGESRELEVQSGQYIEIEVVGIAFNLWGPWRNTQRREKVAWALDWMGDKVNVQKLLPNQYPMLDCGILKNVTNKNQVI